MTDISTNAPLAKEHLHAFIQRIEHLEAEKAEVVEDIKEVYLEAKDMGFDAKLMRTIVSLRKKDSAEREEEQAMRDVYLHALGMIPD
ncbi:MAG: DUF2312 domain-containing protein [Kordiimonadaceae bacterium]|nr:DUF2312 domain-containing protein [Kordiimonadaceae bacterium]